jgi:hypothetical protein
MLQGAWRPIYTGELGRGGRGLLQRRTSIHLVQAALGRRPGKVQARGELMILVTPSWQALISGATIGLPL